MGTVVGSCNLFKDRIVVALMIIWIGFSTVIFALSFLLEFENGAVLLGHLGIDSRTLDNFLRLSFWEKSQLILAFSVRFTFLYFLLQRVTSYRCRVTSFWLSNKEVASFLIAVVIPIAFFLGYTPLLYSYWLLLAFLVGRLQRNAFFALIFLAIVLVLGSFLNFGRGQVFFGMVAMLMGLRLSLKSTFVLSAFLVVALLSATLTKFETDDATIGLNIVYRFGVLNQLTPYLLSSVIEMNSSVPVSVDLFQNLPLVRGFFGILNETEIFYAITDGSSGALAVGPEVRALTYWNNFPIALVDLAIFYLIFFFSLSLMLKYLPGSGLAIFLLFPSLIQFDTVPVAALAIQSCIFTSFTLLAFYALRRRGGKQAVDSIPACEAVRPSAENVIGGGFRRPAKH